MFIYRPRHADVAVDADDFSFEIVERAARIPGDHGRGGGDGVVESAFCASFDNASETDRTGASDDWSAGVAGGDGKFTDFVGLFLDVGAEGEWSGGVDFE